MAYSYEIRFSTGAYAELLPSNQLELVGGWEVGTMIWREKIGEVKIGRLKNPTIYDTLESWFDDDTKFATRINIKILKDSVEESVHWFGVKWGTINEYQKTYTITPIPYDLWGQYFESTKGASSSEVADSTVPYHYYGETGFYSYVAQFLNEKILEEAIKHYSSESSGWSDADIVSSFMWQDAYEDSSAVGTYNGMPLDYVTGVQSFLKYAGIITLGKKSFEDVLTWLNLLRVFVYFDSNDKLRFEHIKFFNDKLTDNAVDYSSLMKPSDERFSYVSPNLPILESVQMSTESDDTDDDFSKSDIIYNDIRNRADAQDIEHTSELKSNLGYYNTAIQDDLFLFAGLKNQVYKFFDTDMDSYSSDFNSINVTWNSTGQSARSNNFNTIGGGNAYLFTSSGVLSGSYSAFLVNDSGGATVSNVLSISAGVATGTLTQTLSPLNTYLKIEAANGSGSYNGWVTVDSTPFFDHTVVPTIDGFTSGDPKSNGAFSVANIIDQWWRDDRYAREATFNSTGYAATSTIFNLARDTINVYYKGGLSDVSKWFLPSQDELNEMYTNLHLFGVGGFQNFNYWSSSEISAIQSRGLAFSSGLPAFAGKTSTFYVRACRSFTDTAGKYSLRDTGPAGGLIFYISGTTYYEAAPSDQSISQAWSNITATLIGTTGTAIGTGEGNTTAIIDQVGHTDSAAKLCDDLAVGLGGDINPLFGWNDGTRIAKIDKWTRNLKTGYYQIDLIYQEDD